MGSLDVLTKELPMISMRFLLTVIKVLVALSNGPATFTLSLQLQRGRTLTAPQPYQISIRRADCHRTPAELDKSLRGAGSERSIPQAKEVGEGFGCVDPG